MATKQTIADDRLNEARLCLTQASDALYCFLNMLGQMDEDATVDAVGLKNLLLPVGGQVSAALDNLL
jgi:hypothetical protein